MPGVHKICSGKNYFISPRVGYRYLEREMTVFLEATIDRKSNNFGKS